MAAAVRASAHSRLLPAAGGNACRRQSTGTRCQRPQHAACCHPDNPLPSPPFPRQVILTRDLDNVGKEGELLTVPIGYLRNYLLPNGIARAASEGVLE